LQETKQFQQAFVAVDSVGQPLLDDLAIAERQAGQEIATNNAKQVTKGTVAQDDTKCQPGWKATDDTDRTKGYINAFCLEDAGFYSKIGDPPLTQTFRRALALVGEFAKALVALADGSSAAAAVTQVQQLVQDAESLAGSLPGASGIGTAVNGIVTALKPLANEAAKAASAEQERSVILEAQPQVAKLIVALQQAAPALFDVLTQQTQKRIRAADHPQAADVARIEAYRVAISDYVVLLGRLREAWNQLAVAAKQPSNSASLASLTLTSAQIVADAATVRQSLAQLRRGTTAN
jgi:hypothetical protein